MADQDRPQSPGDAGSPLSSAVTNTERGRRPSILRNAAETFTQSRPPVGMFHAYGNIISNIPTVEDVQKGNFTHDGWSGPAQRRNSQAHRPTDGHVLNLHQEREKSIAGDLKKTPTIEVGKEESEKNGSEKNGEEIEGMTSPQTGDGETSSAVLNPNDPGALYPNGYQFPPKHTKWQATNIFLIGFWKFFITPFGFIVTIYGLNVVAWGGMLFLILCRATPAMAHPSYDNDYSGAKIWLEIDSQILNALFCVTGLGLIPWRFRDLYYLLQWRWRKNPDGIRRLAGIQRGWFRLQGSQELNPKYDPKADGIIPGVNEAALAIPIALSPDPPLTGERAPPTKYWKLDFVIWAFVINTFLQIMLCGFMWGYNRFHRPSWVVGLIISVACIVAAAGGIMIAMEGKRVKKIEGVPVSAEDQEILRQMREKEGQSA